MWYVLFIYEYTCSVINFLVALFCIYLTVQLETGWMVSLYGDFYFSEEP